MPPKFFGGKRDREDDRNGAPPARGGFNHDGNNRFVRRDGGNGSGGWNNNRNNSGYGNRSHRSDAAKKDSAALAAEKAAAHGYTFVERATSDAAVAFFNAVKEGHAWKVKSLLDGGSKEFVNSIDWQGYAPLHYAAARIPISDTKFSKPSAALVATLLEVEGINVEIRDIVPRNHCTPLYHAVANGSCNTMQVLLAFHNEANAEKGLPVCVDVNSVSNKCTPLARAILKDEFSKFRLLFANDTPAGAADPTITSTTGITPLHCAADQANIDIMKMLLEDGRSDVNARSGTAQRTVFMCAASPAGGEAAAARSPDAIKLLLDYVGPKGEKVDFNARMTNGQTALHIAATWGQVRSIPALCAIDGMDVNAKDNEGRTPLHCAMGTSDKFPPHLTTIEALLKVKGIDMEAVDKNGKTALELCQGKQFQEEIEEAFNVAKKRNKQ